MNPEEQAELVKAIARALHIPAECIGNWMIHAETSSGIIVIHTCPDDLLYRELLIQLIGDRPVPLNIEEVN